MSRELSPSEAQAVQEVFDRVSERGWGLALGALAAIALFTATAILVVKGGPNPGPHLSLLGNYFPGYSVTWMGALIGAAYAFVVAYAAGRLIAALYNRLVPR